MLVRKNPFFPLRSDRYPTYGKVRAMRESMGGSEGGENWTVVGQTNVLERGREKLDSSRTDIHTGGREGKI